MRTKEQFLTEVYMTKWAEGTDFAAYMFLKNCFQERALTGEKCIAESIKQGIAEADYCYDPLHTESIY
jgi:hypothetical protein